MTPLGSLVSLRLAIDGMEEDLWLASRRPYFATTSLIMSLEVHKYEQRATVLRGAFYRSHDDNFRLPVV